MLVWCGAFCARRVDASGINAPDVHPSALVSPISTIAIAVTPTHVENMTPRARDTLLHHRLQCGLARGLSFELHDSFGESECSHVGAMSLKSMSTILRLQLRQSGTIQVNAESLAHFAIQTEQSLYFRVEMTGRASF